MMDKARHPKQRQIFRRLDAAGCPIDWEHLRTAYPLQVETIGSNLPTNVFPIPDATGIVLPVEIVLSAPLLIGGHELRADWLPQSLSWLNACDQHSDSYCFHECDLQIDYIWVFNWFLLKPGLLKRGSVTRGFLIGKFPGTLPSTAGAKLEATLLIHDLSGDEYPFPVSIDNPKLGSRPASAI